MSLVSNVKLRHPIIASKMAESAPSDCSSPDTDRDFDPSADMLVNDYDDERTMEEEEALSGESCSNELDDLEKEGDMPIEDLLAMYGYNNQTGGGGGPPVAASEMTDTRSSSEEEILSNQDLTLDKEVIARDLLNNEDDRETSVNDLLDSVEPSQTVRLLRSANSRQASEDEDTEDEDYEPDRDDDWKKSIQVGHDFQAEVPQGLSKYDDTPAYENEDRLLWDPSKLEDLEVEKYLKDVHLQTSNTAKSVNSVPKGTHVRDDEQALYLLLQCGHNVDEAVRRRRVQTVPPTDPMSLWSEEECRNFENGLRTYGKDFYKIQQNKVRTRTVGELVQFYYLWKKTERHDIFANKTRLEKKKYALHPGITDYMDRFMDEQENPSPMKDRSASPIHSLIYGDHKRHHKYDDSTLPELTGPPTSASLGGVSLNPELNTGVPTTLSGSLSAAVADGQNYVDNFVHIANMLPNMTPELVANHLEPPNKKLKSEDDSIQKVCSSTSDILTFTPTLDSDALAKLEQISNNPMGNVELSFSSVSPSITSTAVSERSINSVARDSPAPPSSEPVEQVAQ